MEAIGGAMRKRIRELLANRLDLHIIFEARFEDADCTALDVLHPIKDAIDTHRFRWACSKERYHDIVFHSRMN